MGVSFVSMRRGGCGLRGDIRYLLRARRSGHGPVVDFVDVPEGGVSGWSGGDGGDGDGRRPTATARRTYTDMIEPPMVMVCASSVTMRHQLTCVNGLSPSPMLISSARTSKVMSTTSFCATDHAVDGAAL